MKIDRLKEGESYGGCLRFIDGQIWVVDRDAGWLVGGGHGRRGGAGGMIDCVSVSGRMVVLLFHT